MNTLEHLRESSRHFQFRHVSVAEVATCSVLSALTSVLAAVLIGRDLNWDFFNYHLYSALMAGGRQVGQDFFAAGYQGYLNPLPYLPLYAMTTLDWSSVAVASGIAVLQSPAFVGLYLVCRTIVGDVSWPRLAALLLTLLGSCTGVVLGQLGSSFVDLLTASPVLFAVWLLMSGSNSSRRLLLIGLLVGLTVGLKLTNVVFLLGVISASAFSKRGPQSQSVRLVCLAAGCGLGVLISAGYWSVQLYEHFHSPLFPTFNQIFRAPDFPVESIQYNRFIPLSVQDLALLPVRMMEIRSWVYVENVCPDIRPVVLLALMVSGLFVVHRSFRLNPGGAPAHVTEDAVRVLGWFVGGSVVAWLPTSSNGRYATPLLLLLGPLIYVAAKRLWGVQVGVGSVAVVLLIQSIHMGQGGNPHFDAQAWTRRWLNGNVPESLRASPRLFLTIGASSSSYLAAYVHPKSIFVNPIGMMSIPTGGPGWNRLQTLIDAHPGAIELVFKEGLKGVGMLAENAFFDRRKALLDRLGLTFTAAACVPLTFNEGDSWAFASQAQTVYQLTSCPATKVSAKNKNLAVAREQAESLMNRIEDRCPSVFRPRRPQVEGNGAIWTRIYGVYDLFLVVNFETGDLYYRMQHQNVDTMIANVRTLDRDLDGFECALPLGGKRGL